VNHGACLLAAGFSKTWMHESYQPAASRLWGCILYYIALGDPLWLAPTHSHPAHTVLAVLVDRGSTSPGAVSAYGAR
jgi:hypothetical protein